MDGTTVEINNTDAEGRLTLGDAITYARTKIAARRDVRLRDAHRRLHGRARTVHRGRDVRPRVAAPRLDGGAPSAPARTCGGCRCNGRLREQLKSQIADMRNTGDRFGGAITAGLFLKTFAKDTPWVHVDIAGPASLTSARPSQPKGGTGFAVATIVELLSGPITTGS